MLRIGMLCSRVNCLTLHRHWSILALTSSLHRVLKRNAINLGVAKITCRGSKFNKISYFRNWYRGVVGMQILVDISWVSAFWKLVCASVYPRAATVYIQIFVALFLWISWFDFWSQKFSSQKFGIIVDVATFCVHRRITSAIVHTCMHAI